MRGPRPRTISSGTSGHAGKLLVLPHTLLYTEPAGSRPWVWSPRPARPKADVDECSRSRRRASPLSEWLDRPSGAPTELRDLGLLQLFFADLASAEARLRLAEQQLAIHRAKLAAYREDERLERRPDWVRGGQRTVEHWRGETLPMGLLYEGAAVDFWTGVVAKARGVAGVVDKR